MLFLKKAKVSGLLIITIAATLLNCFIADADEQDVFAQIVSMRMDKHLEYFKNRNYSVTYNDFCSGLKDNMPLKEYSAKMDLLLDKIGNLKSYIMRDIYYIASYKQKKMKSINVIYDAKFMNGEGEINATFIMDKDGSLKLNDFSIYSPLVYDMLQEMPENERKQLIN